jgi:hypothetical protein
VAFGRGFVSGGGGGGAGRADVEFRANIGKFRADVNEARQVYQRTTGQMSDVALRMAVAQEKLDRAIHKYGAESRQARQATIAYRNEMRSLQRQVDRTGDEVDQTRRQMDRAGRGALAASGIFGGLGRSLAFASSSFLGGAGLIFALRSFVSAATDAERVQVKVKTAVENAGISYDQHANKIDRVIRAHSRLSGLDDEELAESFANMIRTTKDVNEALELNALTADIARTKGQDLAAAQSLVARVYLGSFLGLKRLGVEFQKTTENQDRLRDSGVKYTRQQMAQAKAADEIANRQRAIAALQQAFGRQARQYGESAAGAQDRFRVALENTQEVIGDGLLPTITHLLNEGSKWLDQQADSGELQRKVNEVVETGTTVVRGLARGFDFLDTAILGPIKKLGLLEEAVGAALILGIVAKTRRAAASFGWIAASSAATRTKVVADAAAMGAALDVATRPRNVVVTTTGVPGGGGGRGRGPAPVPVPVGRGGLVGTAIIVATALFGPEIVEGLGGLNQEFGRDDYRKLLRAARQGRLTYDHIDQLAPLLSDAQERRLRYLISVAGGPEAHDARIGGVEAEQRQRDRDRPGGSRSRRRRTLADIELDVARAGATPGRADDLLRYRELRDFYQRQVSALEARKHLTDEQKERLQDLYGSLASAQSQIDSIIDEGERKLEEQKQKAREKRQRMLDQLEAQARRAEERAGERRLAPGLALLRSGVRKVREREQLQELREMRRRNREAREEDRPLTAAEVRAMHFEFLSGLRGVMNQFGGNLFPPGAFAGMDQAGTQSIVQTALLREQNQQLERLSRGMWFPGAGYSRARLSAAGFGVGF